MKIIKVNPYSAPALVDCTKCETPIAVLAKMIPGPNFCNFFLKSINQNLDLLLDNWDL